MTQSSRRQSVTAFFDRPRPRRIAKFGVLWLTVFAVLMSFFLNRILFSQNYLETFPGEVILPTAMHAFTAFWITAIMYWYRPLRTMAAKTISALILALFMVEYDGALLTAGGLLRSFIPGLTEADSLPTLSVIYLVMLVMLSVLAGLGYQRLQRKYPRIEHKNVWIGMLIVTGYLLIVPTFSVAKVFPSMMEQSRVQAPEFAKPPTTPAKDAKHKPDIFYFVLDRYTSDSVLKEQFNFDNSKFSDFLRQNNFYVNGNAHSSYPYTTSSVASTLTAGYTKPFVAPYADDPVQSKTLYHNLIWQSPVIKAMKDQGYRYYNIGTWYGATYKAPLADQDHARLHMVELFGREKRLRGIEFTELEQSPYYRLGHFQAGWWPYKNKNMLGHTGTIDQLNLLDWATLQDKPGGRFIFSHILVPHPPFYYNADGSLAIQPASDNIGKPIKEKYINQVEFINSQMERIVTQIKQQSGEDSVIIFNADEGPYPQALNDTLRSNSWDAAGIEGDGFFQGDMRDWPDDWLKMKFGIQQAAHIPKATDKDLQHLNSVNLFRIVLNRYFGYDLDYLPQCQLAFSDGGIHEYRYADITDRLTPQADNSEYCQQHATSK